MRTITVNANIQFDIHDKATPEAIESIITLINDTLGMCEFESQPQVMADSVKLVEEKFNEHFVGLDDREEEIRQLTVCLNYESNSRQKQK